MWKRRMKRKLKSPNDMSSVKYAVKQSGSIGFPSLRTCPWRYETILEYPLAMVSVGLGLCPEIW